MIKGKCICITGFAGSIGSELTRQLAPHNKLCGIDIHETEAFDLYEELYQEGKPIFTIMGDICNGNLLKRAYKTFGKFDYIFHCAALKHVMPSAWWPEEYVKTNILGTLRAIELAKINNAKLINISTDKVVDSTCVMGATKRVAEIAVRDAGFVSVRFGNVMGSRGSVLELWQKQIDNKKPLTVTDKNMKRYMMTIPEAVGLVIEAAEVGQPGQIIVLKMGKPVGILELAEKILKEKRSEVGVKMIGRRVGEKLEEVLMDEDEKKRVREIGNFWVIPPEIINYSKGGDYSEKNSEKEKDNNTEKTEKGKN